MKQLSLIAPDKKSNRAVAHGNDETNEGSSVQAKLAVGEPDDQYEQEADKVADTVMSMPEAETSSEDEEKLQTKPLSAQITPLVQRQSEEEESLQAKLIQRESLEEEDKETQNIQTKLVRRQPEDEEPLQTKLIQRHPEEDEKPLQTKQISKGEDHSANTSWLENQLQGTKGTGSHLPDDTRSVMENRFGTDFSSVRIHTGTDAVQMNKELHAQAFSHGNDVYFNSTKFSPESSSGKHLLAHELTHVVQQSGDIHKKQFQVSSGLPSLIQRKSKHCKHFNVTDTFYSTKEEAASKVTRANPSSCFIFHDGPKEYPYRPIPDYGCAHYVAHQLGITNGKSEWEKCDLGFSISVSQFRETYLELPFDQAQVGDIWSLGNEGHCGIVTAIGTGSHEGQIVYRACGTNGQIYSVWAEGGRIFRLR